MQERIRWWSLYERTSVEFSSEVLDEVRSFNYLGLTIAANNGVESGVSNLVNEVCELLGALKNKRVEMKI